MPIGSPRPGPRPARRREKKCRRCGNPYWGRKHGYCSPACGEAARAEHLAAVVITPAVLEGLDRSPITQPDERNHSAKCWSLISPDGVRYSFRNLANFVREHASLFAAEDIILNSLRPTSFGCRATIGLGQLHPDRRMKKKTESWKGWRWDYSV